MNTWTVELIVYDEYESQRIDVDEDSKLAALVLASLKSQCAHKEAMRTSNLRLSRVGAVVSVRLAQSMFHCEAT